MYALTRTKCGIFNLDDAFTLSQIQSNKFEMISVEKLFDYKRINLDDDDFQKLSNGIAIFYQDDGFYKAYHNDSYLGNVSVVNGKMKFVLRLF